LTTALAAAALASAALAGPIVFGKDGNTQSIEVKLSPKKLSKTGSTPVALDVTTKTSTTTAANGVPSPAVQAAIDFDKNVKLFTKGFPTCSQGLIENTSTETALEACGKAKIGGGHAVTLLPVGEHVFTEPVTVTAFNGVPVGGKPVVLLHTYGTAPVQVTIVLVGTVTGFNKEGYGPRLTLSIPPLAGGTGALTEFQATISKTFKYKGAKRSYVSAGCASKTLKSRGTFTFRDGEALTALSTSRCTQGK
jgi:hypothetical protein